MTGPDPTRYADGLVRRGDGLWEARATRAVSYPEGGHDRCFELEDGSFWFAHRNACLSAVLERFPPPGPLFDVGGGNGFVARGLQDAGFEVAVVEPGADGAAHALRRGVGTVIRAAFEDVGFRVAAVPAVGLFDVLEHMEDDGACLRDVRLRLARNGRLYLTVPAYGWLWSNEDRHAGHFRRYSRRSLERVLRESGLEPEMTTYLFSFLVLPVALLRALPSRLGLRRRSQAARTRREHGAPGRGAGRLLGRLTAWEEGRLAAGGTLPVGASLLAVARVVEP